VNGGGNSKVPEPAIFLGNGGFFEGGNGGLRHFRRDV